MLDRNDAATAALLRATAGQYTLEREVGRGGMGIVFLGTDEALHRPVAIKTLPPHLAADAKIRRRFQQEARAAGALSHPNIVPIYAAAERDGVVYFAMRYINGESLAERIARLGPLSPSEVVSLLRQLASALGYAHANRVVHRDIKAENVLLDSETGRAMLTDFGIARLNETQTLTATGTVLGTVQYMSPEQVTGEDLDGRSDLYSLGVLAFYSLCGRFPFERPTASAIVVAHVTSAPPKLCSLATTVPAALGDVIDRLLAKSPGDRYADGQALRAALDALPADVVGTTTAPVEKYAARDLGMDSAGGSGLAPALRPFAALSNANPQPESTPDPNQPDTRQVLSSADAEQVWARAAELQANTGLIVPPSQFELRNAGVPSDTVGFDASVVRASAMDAGIDAKYVDRAMEERARAASVARTTGGSLPAVSISDTNRRKANWIVGRRTKIELETSFDGELNEQGFEEVLDEIRLSLGEMVTVSAVGRTLTVTSAAGGRNHQPRRIQLHLSSRNGRTVVRAFEDLKQSAMALYVGLVLGGGSGLGVGVLGAVIGATHSPALGLAALGGLLGSAYGLARTLFTRTVRTRDEELREVLRRVVARAQDTLPQNSQNAFPSPVNTRRLPRG